MPSPQRKATPVAKTASPKRFVFLLLDRFTMLSFAGAIEPLRIANRIAGEEIYRWVLAGEGEFVTCSTARRSSWTSGWKRSSVTMWCWSAAALTCKRLQPKAC